MRTSARSVRHILFAALLTLLAIPASAQLRSVVEIRNGKGGLGNVLSNEDRFGSSIATLGDLDGDGIPELAVSAPYDDDGSYDAGSVHILFMNRDGNVRANSRISPTEGGFPFPLTNQGHFGRSVAALGDVDRDGVPDMIVGEPEGRGIEVRTGAAYVVRLKADGSVKGAEKIVVPNTLPQGWSMSFGDAVAGPGDIDGDGIPDAVVAATGAQEINILFLTTTGSVRERHIIDTNHPLLAATLRQFEHLGQSVAGIGDHNGDGIPDLATGIDNDNGGRVLLLMLGRNGAPFDMLEISSTATTALAGHLGIGDYFGYAITDLGDIDGNGRRDLAIGAWGDDLGPDRHNTGAIYVMKLGSGSQALSVVKIDATSPLLAPRLGSEDYFGRAIASLGDLNRDGSLDLVSGVDWDDQTPQGWAEGAVMVVFGDEQIPTSVRPGVVANELSLSAPAPNPFATTTRLVLTLHTAQHLRVTLADPLGREVATVLDGHHAAGEHSITVDGSSLHPGLYLLRLQGESFSQARQVTVVR